MFQILLSEWEKEGPKISVICDFYFKVICEKSQKTRISVYLKYGIILMHLFGSREDNFSNETIFFLFTMQI